MTIVNYDTPSLSAFWHCQFTNLTDDVVPSSYVAVATKRPRANGSAVGVPAASDSRATVLPAMSDMTTSQFLPADSMSVPPSCLADSWELSALVLSIEACVVS